MAGPGFVFVALPHACSVGDIINVRRKPYDTKLGRLPDWSQAPVETVREALTILAEEGGDIARTVERCKTETSRPSEAWELKEWRDEKHPQIWVQIHSDHEKELERIAEAKARENAIRAAVVAGKAVDRIDKQIGDADLLSAAKALDSVAKAGSQSVDQVLKWSGRPVSGGSGGSPAETLEAIRKLAPDLFVDSSAVEDATIVDDPAAHGVS
jgi:hypothetical protein